MQQPLLRSLLIWTGLLVTSVVLHLVLSREAGTQLALVISPDAQIVEEIELKAELGLAKLDAPA